MVRTLTYSLLGCSRRAEVRHVRELHTTLCAASLFEVLRSFARPLLLTMPALLALLRHFAGCRCAAGVPW
jgi:hypothetical protein